MSDAPSLAELLMQLRYEVQDIRRRLLALELQGSLVMTRLAAVENLAGIRVGHMAGTGDTPR